MGRNEPGGTGEASGTAEETAEAGETGAAAVLGAIADRLAKLEEQAAEFHRRSAYRESIIDRLHEENQRLHGGVGRIVLEPVITDLIRLHDELSREARRVADTGGDGRLLVSFAGDVAQILDRCGIELFSARPGDPFERGRHRVLTTVACYDKTLHNTVADAAADGFTERDSGRVRRPAHVHVFQYTEESL